MLEWDGVKRKLEKNKDFKIFEGKGTRKQEMKGLLNGILMILI